MSASCVGTCSHCGVSRFWLSNTLSLQLDDGRLICLPHPAEAWKCEEKGLTLEQASQRGRLYQEVFFVCRNCGRHGEVIQKVTWTEVESPTASIDRVFNRCWWVALLSLPLLAWMRWWEELVVIGSTLVAVAWKERDQHKALEKNSQHPTLRDVFWLANRQRDVLKELWWGEC